MNNGAVLFFTLLLAGFYLLYCTAIPVRTIDIDPSKISFNREMNDDRPKCYKWHTVGKGETQWVLSERYSSHSDTWRWIKSMRWMSRKSEGDEGLKAGESVCVSWARSV